MPSSKEPPNELSEARLRAELEEAVRTTHDVQSTYLGLLAELVGDYASLLQQRGVGRAETQRTLARIVDQGTSDPHSVLRLYVARWVDAMYPSGGTGSQ